MDGMHRLGNRSNAARVALAMLGLALRVHAADAASEAQARFDEGKRLYRVKHDAEGARAKFAQAYALAPRLETLWNLAVCELDLGRNEEAAAHLRRYARDPDARPANLERVPALLATARAKLGALRIVAPPEAVVRLDGHLVDPRDWQGESIDLAPGDHVLVVARAGERLEDIVALRIGETTEHRVPAAPLREEPLVGAAPAAAGTPNAPAPSSVAATSEGPTGAAWPLTLGAIGVAALGGGVAFALASQSHAEDADRARGELMGADCTNSNVPACERLRAAVDTGTAHAWLAIGSYTLAGALLGTAAWLAWKPTQREPLEARVGPGGFALRVRF